MEHLTPQLPRPPVRWEKSPGALHYANAWCGDVPLVYRGHAGLVTVTSGRGDRWPETSLSFEPNALAPLPQPVRQRVRQRLRRGTAARDVLETEVTLVNRGKVAVPVLLDFSSSAHPSLSRTHERVHLPLSAAGLATHWAIKEIIAESPLLEADHVLGVPGENAAAFSCHYLEPRASGCQEIKTRAPLLIPLVQLSQPVAALRLSFFAGAGRAWRIVFAGNMCGAGGCSFGTQFLLQPGQTVTERFWVLAHYGAPEEAWRVFHALAHHRRSTVRWLRETKVHYYDFLSPAALQGRRGLGFDADCKRFREFGVGMATQHGYYPYMGDYVHPDRRRWTAMASDRFGGFTMSLDLMRRRIARTRAQGARAAVYLHASGLDSASPCAASLHHAIAYDSSHQPLELTYWRGPETVGTLWHMSMAAPAWREHLLQQAEWIMELLEPDALLVDETFSGVGHDFHPNRNCALSPGAIEFYQALRQLVHRHGPDKALLTSDCSLASFVLWADGEAGDHAYTTLLGHPLYRKEPVRYLAALGDRPWVPCAWQFVGFWPEQVELARKTGCGVGVSAGWIEYTGLCHLPREFEKQILEDVRGLTGRRAKPFPQLKSSSLPACHGGSSP
jgi:hypothetical protein